MIPKSLVDEEIRRLIYKKHIVGSFPELSNFSDMNLELDLAWSLTLREGCRLKVFKTGS